MNAPRNRQTVTYIFSASLLLVALFPARLAASTLTLAWYSNIEGDLAGYSLYYGTRSGDYDSVIYLGNVSRYTVKGLEPETRYYLALTAYDISGNESDFSEEVSGVTEEVYLEWGCFIATAAYGSYLNPQVKILRDFRDEFLISNFLGRKFVHLYYKYGPRIANYMGKYGSLRFLTRQALLPLIGMSSLSLKITASQKLLLLSLCLLLIFTTALRSYLRHTP